MYLVLPVWAWFLPPIYHTSFWPPIKKAAVMHPLSLPWLSACLLTYLPACMSVCLSVCRYTNKMLRTTKLIFSI